MSLRNLCMEKYKDIDMCLKPDFKKTTLMLELTNYCNHACMFCNHIKMTRDIVIMDKEFAFNIIDQAAVLGIKKIGLFMSGEPLAVNYLHELITYSKLLGIEYVYISTNGSMGTKERWLQMAKSGIDSIKFSINAGSRETYKLVHGADDFDKVLEHLKLLHLFRKTYYLDYKLYVSIVVTPMVVDEIDKLKKSVQEYVDDIVIYKVQTRAGENIDQMNRWYTDYYSRETKEYFSPTAPCIFLFNSINITCEGYMCLCCEEVNNLLVVHDMHNTTIKSAWHSPQMIKLRQLHFENKLEGLQCYNCVNLCDMPVFSINDMINDKE